MANAHVALFAGEYDLSSRQKLREELVMLGVLSNVVIDLSRVSYIDASCVGEFKRLHQIRATNGFDRETIIVPANMEKTFAAMNMAESFYIVSAHDGSLDDSGAQTLVTGRQESRTIAYGRRHVRQNRPSN
jgi:anti-anti-sigma regulatory factor